jgi:hypothetical protein
MSKAAFASALILATFAAQAQAVYKCAQPGGNVSYQSTPCVVPGAKPASHPTAAQLNALRASAPVVAAAPTGDPYGDDRRRRDCTVALQNQMVLKRVAQNPNSRAFTTDKSGHRDYVAPGENAGLIAKNERAASAKCD